MKVLVVGSGGREHALAWRILQSSKVHQVFAAPGNGGTAQNAHITNVPITDVDELQAWALDNEIGLTVIGPEAPLAAGIVDAFKAAGLRVFGPTQAAAQLESSKAFCKDFMQRHNVPTAEYATFSDAQQAHDYVTEKGAPIVIKADGLAAGKGVVVAMTQEEAHEAIDWILGDGLKVEHNKDASGQAVAKVVIEEFLDGEEASFIVVSDGKDVSVMATSQDHKRLLDGDEGPNTGGMGAYSPAPVVTPDVRAKVMREIIRPTIQGMAADGMPFTGFLYAGLMIMSNGDVKTLEFNCRMGDPETQPIMMRLKSDLVDVLVAAADGKLGDTDMEWDRRVALGVVLASEGYPASPRKGDAITLPELPEDAPAMIFHAGTRVDENGTLVTSGGRVLCVTVLADSLKQAQKDVYERVMQVQFGGMQYRKDIGNKGLAN